MTNSLNGTSSTRPSKKKKTVNSVAPILTDSKEGLNISINANVLQTSNNVIPTPQLIASNHTVSPLENETLNSLVRKTAAKRKPLTDGRFKSGQYTIESISGLKAGLTINLHHNGFTLDSQNLLHPYDRSTRELLIAIDNGKLLSELVDLLDEKVHCQYYDGCVLVEIRDLRSQILGAPKVNPPSRQVLLKPDLETILVDIQRILASYPNAVSSQDDLIRLEHKISMAAQPQELCLSPTPRAFEISSDFHYNRLKFHTRKPKGIESAANPPIPLITNPENFKDPFNHRNDTPKYPPTRFGIMKYLVQRRIPAPSANVSSAPTTPTHSPRHYKSNNNNSNNHNNNNNSNNENKNIPEFHPPVNDITKAHFPYHLQHPRKTFHLTVDKKANNHRTELKTERQKNSSNFTNLELEKILIGGVSLPRNIARPIAGTIASITSLPSSSPSTPTSPPLDSKSKTSVLQKLKAPNLPPLSSCKTPGVELVNDRIIKYHSQSTLMVYTYELICKGGGIGYEVLIKMNEEPFQNTPYPHHADRSQVIRVVIGSRSQALNFVGQLRTLLERDSSLTIYYDSLLPHSQLTQLAHQVQILRNQIETRHQALLTPGHHSMVASHHPHNLPPQHPNYPIQHNPQNPQNPQSQGFPSRPMVGPQGARIMMQPPQQQILPHHPQQGAQVGNNQVQGHNAHVVHQGASPNLTATNPMQGVTGLVGGPNMNPAMNNAGMGMQNLNYIRSPATNSVQNSTAGVPHMTLPGAAVVLTPNPTLTLARGNSTGINLEPSNPANPNQAQQGGSVMAFTISPSHPHPHQNPSQGNPQQVTSSPTLSATSTPVSLNPGQNPQQIGQPQPAMQGVVYNQAGQATIVNRVPQGQSNYIATSYHPAYMQRLSPQLSGNAGNVPQYTPAPGNSVPINHPGGPYPQRTVSPTMHPQNTVPVQIGHHLQHHVVAGPPHPHYPNNPNQPQHHPQQQQQQQRQ